MKKAKTLLFLFLLAGFLFNGHAQSVTLMVTTTDGIEQTYHMTEEGQLYFENGERLVIDDGSKTVASFPLADIQKMVCSEITGVTAETASQLSLFPNPSHDSFLIKNLRTNCLARIYTLDGRLIKVFEASEGQMVDISDLSEGMYLLHMDGQTLKLMKL